MKQLLSFDTVAKEQQREQELQLLINENKDTETILDSSSENKFVGRTIDNGEQDLLEPDPIYSTEIVGYPNRQVQYHFYSIIQNFIHSFRSNK